MNINHIILAITLQATRITSHSKKLIDNVFSFFISVEITSCNITATISYHLLQLLFFANILTKLSSQKFNFHERGWSKLNQDDFILDYFDKSWPELLRIDQQNVNLTMEFFFKPNEFHHGYSYIITNVNKYRLKFNTKPWITPALQKSISIKNNIRK